MAHVKREVLGAPAEKIILGLEFSICFLKLGDLISKGGFVAAGIPKEPEGPRDP